MSAYECNVIIDLEFNPTPKDIRKKGLKHEIVEIGAVKLNSKGQTLGTFSCTVRPTLSNAIAGKITHLTGIRTCDVSQSEELEASLIALAEWIETDNARIVSWSKNDRRQIEKECAFKDIEIPKQLSRWLDLQVVYPRVMGVGNGRKMKLSTAIDWYGSEIDSDEAHRALYDAKMTAELMRQLVTGEHHLQQKAINSALAQRSSEGGSLSSNLASACSGLEALRLQLLAKEQQSAA